MNPRTKTIILSITIVAILVSVGGILVVSSSAWQQPPRVNPFKTPTFEQRKGIMNEVVKKDGRLPPKFTHVGPGKTETSPPLEVPTEEAKKAADDSAVAKLKQGKELQEKGKINEAKQLYEQIIIEHPDSKVSEEALKLLNTLK